MEGDQLQLQLQQALQQVQALQAQVNALQAVATTDELRIHQIQELEGQVATLQARVKPAQSPERFEANAKQVRDLDMWLRSVKDWLAVQGITNVRYQILQCVTLFGTVPLRWWTQIAPNAGDVPFATWDEFVMNLKLAF